MKGLKNFVILAVLVTVTAVGVEIISQGATGTEKQLFDLLKQMTKVLGALVLPLGIYFIAKELS